MNPHNPADKDQEIARLTALVGKMREAWAKEYEAELTDIEASIKAQTDGFGRNFFQGKHSGLIQGDLIMQRLLSLTPADMGEWVRKEELAQAINEREAARCVRNQYEGDARLYRARMIEAQGVRDDLRAKLAEVEKEMDRRFDCHAGAGTTELACGACTTCLLNEIESSTVQLASAKARIVELEATVQFAFDEIDNRYGGAEDSKTLWLSHTLDRLHAALAKKGTE